MSIPDRLHGKTPITQHQKSYGDFGTKGVTHIDESELHP